MSALSIELYFLDFWHANFVSSSPHLNLVKPMQPTIVTGKSYHSCFTIKSESQATFAVFVVDTKTFVDIP